MMGEAREAGRGSRVAGRGFHQLRAWQKAHELALATFSAAEPLRSTRRSFADQLTRAALSVPANIAEGYNRGSIREYLQFLSVARGSLAEVEYYVLFARDAGLVSPDRCDELFGLTDDAGSILLGLIRSLQTKNGRRSSAQTAANRSPRPATRDPRPLAEGP